MISSELQRRGKPFRPAPITLSWAAPLLTRRILALRWCGCPSRWFDRNAALDLGPACRLRHYRHRALHQARSLPHAHEPNALGVHRGGWIKASSAISNHEMKFVCHSLQPCLEVPYSAVFYGIIQRFLQNPEKAQRDRFGQSV